MRSEAEDFEFERRFLVDSIPPELIADQNPSVIVQTYFLAADGYALRVRLQATSCPVALPLGADGKAPIELFEPYFDLCMLTVKGPMVGGTRYEAERELDVSVGIEMSMRGGQTISKRRYGVWIDQDGWVIDQFSGPNRPLVIAECERTSPVIDLAIPSFCTLEVTDDFRFSNDSLASTPYGKWGDTGEFAANRTTEFSAEAPLGSKDQGSESPRRFLQNFGNNSPSSI